MCVLSALGVDDTRMDLSQFDDSQPGRATPSSRTPPVINIVSASPPPFIESAEVTVPAGTEGSAAEETESQPSKELQPGRLCCSATCLKYPLVISWLFA